MPWQPCLRQIVTLTQYTVAPSCLHHTERSSLLPKERRVCPSLERGGSTALLGRDWEGNGTLPNEPVPLGTSAGQFMGILYLWLASGALWNCLLRQGAFYYLWPSPQDQPYTGSGVYCRPKNGLWPQSYCQVEFSHFTDRDSEAETGAVTSLRPHRELAGPGAGSDSWDGWRAHLPT